MESREVTHTGKDEHEVITKLCNPESEWKSVSAKKAIKQIDDRTHEYFVGGGEQIVPVLVVPRGVGKYLRTSRDETDANNLDELPDC